MKNIMFGIAIIVGQVLVADFVTAIPLIGFFFTISIFFLGPAFIWLGIQDITSERKSS